ncbi:MAG: DNA repair protein RecO C-terminal domain-containing protein [Oleispira sp.]
MTIPTDLKQSYYVLHRKPYRENSQIIDLLCEKQGRFSALYRVSKKQPELQPFIPYQMQFSGRGDLKYCQHVEIHYPDFQIDEGEFFSGNRLRGKCLQGKNLYCGFYLNELIMRLTWKDEPQQGLFTVYQQTLQGLLLLESDQQSEPFLRRFEFHLLTILGYQYNWLQDTDCHDIQPAQYYNFDPAAGFKALNVANYGLHIPSTRSNTVFSGETILAIAADDWQHTMSWKVAKQIARLALQPLLGHKPLMSRALFQTL